MAHEIESQWMGKMQFNALVNDHTIIMDAPKRVGGEDAGPIPKPFILTALSGCTGMDVISLLRKENKQLDDFNVKVKGEISKQHPIVYTEIHVTYECRGKIENQQATLDAITLSQEKICGVSNMLKRILPLTWEINYNGVVIFNNKQEQVAEQIM